MKKIFILLLILQMFFIPAQADKLRAKTISINTNEKPYILVKWIYSGVYFDKGIIIYRKELPAGEWIQITPTPLLKGIYQIPEIEFTKDTLLKEYCTLAAARDTGTKTQMLNILLLLKLIENNHFAGFLGMMYRDTIVQPGKQYTYKAVPAWKDSALAGYSDTVICGKDNKQRLEEDVWFKPGDSSCFIHWKPDPMKFYGVNIYRRDSAGGEIKKVNRQPVILLQPQGKKYNPNDTCYTDKKLNNGKTYFYSLGFMGFFNNELMQTNETAVQPKDFTPPLRPLPPQPVIKHNNVLLSLDKYNDTSSIYLSLLRSRNYDTGYTAVAALPVPLPDTILRDTIINPGTLYYCIEAKDKQGNRSRSAVNAIDVADIFAPPVPVIINCIADTGKITISWQPVNSNDLLGYSVYRSSYDSEKHFTLITVQPVKETTFSDYLPKEIISRFSYKITATDTGYNQSKYSSVVSCRMPDVTPPAIPVIKSITAADTAVIIEWIKNADYDLLGYNIYRAVKTDREPKKINTVPLKPHLNRMIDKTAETGKDYIYFIQAIDSTMNTSHLSVPIPVFIPSLKKQIIKLNLETTINRKAIVLKWKCNRDEIAIVYRKTANSGFIPLNKPEHHDSFSDLTAIPGKSYIYEVRIYDQEGLKGISDEVKIER